MPVTATGAVPSWRRAGVVLATLAIAACIVTILRAESGSRSFDDPARVAPDPVMNMLARYGYGSRLLTAAMPQQDVDVASAVDRSLQPLTREPVDRFRAEIVRSFMHQRPLDARLLVDLHAATPWLGHDVTALTEIQREGRAASPETWEWFLGRHGWIARLARSQALPSDDPEMDALRGDAIRTVAGWMGAVIMAGLCAIVGMVLLVVLLLRWRQGRLSAGMEPLPSTWGGVSLEAFAIYLCGWTLVPLTLHRLLPDVSRWWLLAVAALSVPVAIFWPLWRGLDRSTWRLSIGLHKGRGFWREAGAGIAGWIATCPLIALGLVAAHFISRATGQEAGHPIIGPLTSGGGTQLAAVLLAVVWAPVAEEFTFRGLLFPGLSAWFRWIGGALAGAFVFAVIHPQGWAGVPAIMAIALGASMVRLVRGSLVAPMAMHAFNNGSLVLMLVLCAG